MWAKYKRAFSNTFYNTLKDVEDFITDAVKKTAKKEVISISSYAYLFLNQIWSIK